MRFRSRSSPGKTGNQDLRSRPSVYWLPSSAGPCQNRARRHRSGSTACWHSRSCASMHWSSTRGASAAGGVSRPGHKPMTRKTDRRADPLPEIDPCNQAHAPPQPCPFKLFPVDSPTWPACASASTSSQAKAATSPIDRRPGEMTWHVPSSRLRMSVPSTWSPRTGTRWWGWAQIQRGKGSSACQRGDLGMGVLPDHRPEVEGTPPSIQRSGFTP